MKEFNVKTREELERAIDIWQTMTSEEEEYYSSFTY